MRLIAFVAPLVLFSLAVANPGEEPLPSIPSMDMGIFEETDNLEQYDLPALGQLENTLSDGAVEAIPDFDMTIFDSTFNQDQADLPALTLQPDVPPVVEDMTIERVVELEVTPNADALLGYLVVPSEKILLDAASILDAKDSDGFHGKTQGEANSLVSFQIRGLEKQKLYRYGIAGQTDSGDAIILKQGLLRLGDDPAETPNYPMDTTHFSWQLEPGAWNMVSIPNGLRAKENSIASNYYVSIAWSFDSDRGFERLSKYETRMRESDEGLFVFATSDTPDEGVRIESSRSDMLKKLSEVKKEWSSLSPNKWYLLGVPHEMAWPKPNDIEIKKPFDGCPTFDLYYYDSVSSVWNITPMIPPNSAVWLIHRCVE